MSEVLRERSGNSSSITSGASALDDATDFVFEAFEAEVCEILQLDDEPIPRQRLRLLKELCLAAGTRIELTLGLDIPSPQISAHLLTAMRHQVPAIERLAPKLTLSPIGCWELPLRAEYDEKERARYPQVNDRELGIKSRLAHRFMMQIGLRATLGRLNFIDHMCRVHACCNPTHLDFVTPAQNNARSIIHSKTVDGQPRLF